MKIRVEIQIPDGKRPNDMVALVRRKLKELPETFRWSVSIVPEARHPLEFAVKRPLSPLELYVFRALGNYCEPPEWLEDMFERDIEGARALMEPFVNALKEQMSNSPAKNPTNWAKRLYDNMEKAHNE